MKQLCSEFSSLSAGVRQLRAPPAAGRSQLSATCRKSKGDVFFSGFSRWHSPETCYTIQSRQSRCGRLNCNKNIYVDMLTLQLVDLDETSREQEGGQFPEHVCWNPTHLTGSFSLSLLFLATWCVQGWVIYCQQLLGELPALSLQLCASNPTRNEHCKLSSGWQVLNSQVLICVPITHTCVRESHTFIQAALDVQCLCCSPLFSSVPGPPVGVGMNIDIASIDMVSEVNMVSRPLSPLLCQ